MLIPIFPSKKFLSSVDINSEIEISPWSDFGTDIQSDGISAQFGAVETHFLTKCDISQKFNRLHMAQIGADYHDWEAASVILSQSNPFTSSPQISDNRGISLVCILKANRIFGQFN